MIVFDNNGPVEATAEQIAFLESVRAAHAVHVFLDLSPVRFKLGMLYLNITPDMVHDAIYALPEPDKTIASIYWESTQIFKRDDPILAQVSASFGVTEQQIDEAWKYAEQLT